MVRPRACTWLLACLFVACQSSSSGHASSPSSSSLLCQPGGGFSAPNDEGVLLDVPDPASHATIIEIWARWCEGCQHAVPALLEQRGKLEADGVRVVLLGVLEDDESVDDARAKLASWGVSEPFMIDRGGTLMRRFGFSELPASVVLDAQGNVRWTSQKGSSANDVVAAALSAASHTCP